MWGVDSQAVGDLRLVSVLIDRCHVEAGAPAPKHGDRDGGCAQST